MLLLSKLLDKRMLIPRLDRRHPTLCQTGNESIVIRIKLDLLLRYYSIGDTDVESRAAISVHRVALQRSLFAIVDSINEEYIINIGVRFDINPKTPRT